MAVFYNPCVVVVVVVVEVVVYTIFFCKNIYVMNIGRMSQINSEYINNAS